MSDAPIISLSSHWDKDRFNKAEQQKKAQQLQKRCKHDEIIFDGVKDEIQCENCKKVWTSFEYLWYWCEAEYRPKIKIYELENTIHFLTEQKDKLETEIKELKSEKRKLKTQSPTNKI